MSIFSMFNTVNYLEGFGICSSIEHSKSVSPASLWDSGTLLLFLFCLPTPFNRDTCYRKVHCVQSLYVPLLLMLTCKHGPLSVPHFQPQPIQLGSCNPVPALGGEESRETGCTREDQGPDPMGHLGISFALDIAISTQELLN